VSAHDSKGLDPRTYAIGVLTITAVVLFVGFLLVIQQPAQALSSMDHAADYKLLTQHISSTKELLIVVDSAAKQALIYDFDYSTKRLEIAADIPLDLMPKPAPPGQQRERPGRRKP